MDKSQSNQSSFTLSNKSSQIRLEPEPARAPVPSHQASNTSVFPKPWHDWSSLNEPEANLSFTADYSTIERQGSNISRFYSYFKRESSRLEESCCHELLAGLERGEQGEVGVAAHPEGSVNEGDQGKELNRTQKFFRAFQQAQVQRSNMQMDTSTVSHKSAKIVKTVLDQIELSDDGEKPVAGNVAIGPKVEEEQVMDKRQLIAQIKRGPTRNSQQQKKSPERQTAKMQEVKKIQPVLQVYKQEQQASPKKQSSESSQRQYESSSSSSSLIQSKPAAEVKPSKQQPKPQQKKQPTNVAIQCDRPQGDGKGSEQKEKVRVIFVDRDQWAEDEDQDQEEEEQQEGQGMNDEQEREDEPSDQDRQQQNGQGEHQDQNYQDQGHDDEPDHDEQYDPEYDDGLGQDEIYSDPEYYGSDNDQEQEQDPQNQLNLDYDPLLNPYNHQENNSLLSNSTADRTNPSILSHSVLAPQPWPQPLPEPRPYSQLQKQYYLAGSHLLQHTTPQLIHNLQQTLAEYNCSNYFHVGPRRQLLYYISGIAEYMGRLGKQVMNCGNVNREADNQRKIKLGRELVGYFTGDKIEEIRGTVGQYCGSNYFHVGPRYTIFGDVRDVIKMYQGY